MESKSTLSIDCINVECWCNQFISSGSSIYFLPLSNLWSYRIKARKVKLLLYIAIMRLLYHHLVAPSNNDIATITGVCVFTVAMFVVIMWSRTKISFWHWTTAMLSSVRYCLGQETLSQLIFYVPLWSAGRTPL